MIVKKLYNAKICISGGVAFLLLLAALPDASAGVDISKELSLSVNQRNDNLNWNIAGSSVNVLSELKWENMSITQLQAVGDIRFKGDLKIRGKLGYGMVGSGSSQDSDYNGDNRTQEYSRSISNVSGDVFDASISLGKIFYLSGLQAGQFFTLSPFVGLSVHQQNLTMKDGVQIIPASGPFPGLDSSYDAQWIGPWWGAEAAIETKRGWVIKANFEYHLLDYSASANWNLRTDMAHPVSFIHDANGDGIFISLGTTVPVRKHWRMEFFLEYGNWSTGAGSDQVFLADGTVGYTRLNEVSWDSSAYRFGIVREF